MVFVEIPDGTKEVAERAFERCRVLLEVEIPETVTSIGERLSGG